MRKAGLGLIGLVLALSACRYVLPERYAVNAPILHMLFGKGSEAPSTETLEARVRVPEGFSLGLWADDLPNSRFLRFTPTGDLLLSQPRAGRIVLLWRDDDGDGRSDGRQVLLEGLDAPHGLDLHDGWLYVGETGAVGRVRFDPETRSTSGALERVVTDLPTGGNHWTRTVRVGPDGWLYVSIGSSCNVCEEGDPRRAAIVRYRPDGSGEEIYATGLRNAVGFDWRPVTGELYATDNGRDLLGDDFPPCELNRVVRGGFYGWPYANGDNVPDPDFGEGNEKRVKEAISPAHGFRAHTAPLGISFLDGDGLPEAYRGAAVAALHGSWNRTEKDGYAVVSLHWGPDGRIEERDFAVGFETAENVIGRPVDVAQGPDGAIYVSDDYAGSVYRIAWNEPSRAAAPAARASAAGDPLAGVSRDDRAAASRRGAALYEANACASCHDAGRAAPGVVVVDLGGLGGRHDLDGLTALLATPPPAMPVPDLDAGARRDLAVYLLERRPARR